MSLRREISDRAQRDLYRQFRWYIKYASVEVADGFFSAFYSSTDRLLEHPKIGWERFFRGRKLSVLKSLLMDAPYEKFIIYYRIESEALWVEHVVHSSRDVPRRLREEAGVYGAVPASTLTAPA